MNDNKNDNDMRRNYHHWNSLTCCIVGMALAACTDSNYDLSDINSTLGFGNEQGFSLPGNNSTKDITMDELLDIDPDGSIKTVDDGSYMFIQQGDDVAPTTVTVNRVTLMASDDNVQLHEMEIEAEHILGARAGGRRKAVNPIEDTVNLFDFQTDHSGDIVSLDYARTSSFITLQVSFTDDLKTVVRNFQEMSLDLPDCFRMSDINVNGRTFSGDDIYQQGNVITLYNVRPSDGDIILQGSITDLYFEQADEVADTTQYLVCDNKAVRMKGHVDILVNLNTDDVNATAYHQNMQLKILSRLQFTDFIIEEAEGRFCPAIDLDDVGNIEVTGVPDFLKDDEVNINLTNPIIYLDINSTLGVPGIIDGVLTSHFKNDKTRSVRVPGIQVKAEDLSRIIICRKAVAGLPNYDQIIEVEDLPTLISQIPESINFSCTAKADATKTGYIVLGHEYTITPSYRFEAPLNFGAGSKIVYRDSINGWNEDLKDITLSANARIVLTTDVESKVPATMTLKPTAIDANGRDLSSDFDITVSKTIAPLTETKDVVITITQKNKDAFRRLDGIIFRVDADIEDGSTLNSLQTLKMKNIGATLYGRVAVDVDSEE